MTMPYRPIPDFSDYLIGLDATIVKRSTGHVMKPLPDKAGYPRLGLIRDDGVRKQRRVHTLMAEAYLGPRPDGLFVLHADDDKSNCGLLNLYYGSRGDNQHDAVLNGRHGQAAKEKCANGHQFTPENTLLGTQVGGVGTHRTCRRCNRDKSRRYRERKRQKG